MTLPQSFFTRPIAHRAFHDIDRACPENSPAAFAAAIAGGYGIELDVQLSSDGRAMVFHDYALDRLTDEVGPIAQRSAAELGQIKLKGGRDTIPTLSQILRQVVGAVPLLIELKDQDGALGQGIGPLEQATARALAGYDGDVAVMSFNPHTVALMAQIAPHIARGLTTCHFPAEDWPTIPAKTRERLRGIPDYDDTGSCFISHQASDLDNPRVKALKEQGAAVFCWTIRSRKDEIRARRIADNVTFEGYAA
ncbi:MAG: phosphodiesterase [Thalassobium sp.]|nr:MAG: phosphodiesterase [Thalassobium sp.]|tara:strand:+ start:58 stop:810 length:753 start_codon:yes stop_codon:yes gene_type:complete